MLVGALIFFVFQMASRIPLLNYLGRLAWYRELMANIFFSAGFLSLTAGLFEEVGRYLGFRYLLAGRRAWKDGMAYGIGHGGIEAMLIVGLAYVNNIILSIMIDSGVYDRIIVPQAGSAVAESIKGQLFQTAPLMFAAAGVERVLTMAVHIALSLVVLYGVRERRLLYLLYAILLHTLVNLPLVLIPGLGWGLGWSGLYLLLAASFSLWYIASSRRYFREA